MNTSLAAKQNAGFEQAWRLAAIALTAVRFVQGWIYWGGGSRRFILRDRRRIDAPGRGMHHRPFFRPDAFIRLARGHMHR